MAILVTGGARSGKSSFAEEYARRSAEQGIYIATCQLYDSEMTERAARHLQMRQDSGFEWETIEEPYDAAGVLQQWASKLSSQQSQPSNPDVSMPVVMLDCLTLWLTNWMLRLEQESDAGELLDNEISRLLRAIEMYPFPLLLVTNEVGGGIVPEYPLGRRFRDEAGRLNQRVAAVCERVFLVTAGIPVELKSQAFRWEQL